MMRSLINNLLLLRSAESVRGRDWVRNSSGLATIEMALTAIVFLSFISGLIWLGFALNARTALIVSMGDALRFGVTRSLQVGSGKIEWASWNPDKTHGENIQQLLFWNAPASKPSDAFNSDWVLQQFFPAKDFSAKLIDPGSLGTSPPKSYLYTILAMHQYMRNRVGKNFLRYPCDDKPACLSCKFIRPDLWTSHKTVDTSIPYSGTLNSDIVAMRCSYNIDFGLANKLFSLKSTGSYQGPQISRTFYVYNGRDS